LCFKLLSLFYIISGCHDYCTCIDRLMKMCVCVSERVSVPTAPELNEMCYERYTIKG